MILITEFGRIDRAAVTARAQEIYYASGAQMAWGDARGQAYREASHQLRAQFSPSSVAIRQPERRAS